MLSQPGSKENSKKVLSSVSPEDRREFSWKMKASSRSSCAVAFVSQSRGSSSGENPLRIQGSTGSSSETVDVSGEVITSSADVLMGIDTSHIVPRWESIDRSGETLIVASCVALANF